MIYKINLSIKIVSILDNKELLNASWQAILYSRAGNKNISKMSIESLNNSGCSA